MVEVAFAVPGDLATPTGGYAYARRMLELLPAQGLSVRHVELPASFPHPIAADLAQTERLLHSMPDDAVLLIDGLAYGAMPRTVIRALRRPIVALVHHPLSLETGLAPERQLELLNSELAALAEARWIIATSAGCVPGVLARAYRNPNWLAVPAASASRSCTTSRHVRRR